MNKRIWAPALVLALGAAGIVRAAPQVEADPNQNYPVTPDLGPWMICAAYFTGPSALDLARQLVLQIRSRNHMPAYLFNYAEEERKKHQALWEQQEQKLPFATPDPGADRVVPIPHKHPIVRVEEQCAVMIGGYPDESAAHAALLAVKQLPPPKLKVQDNVLPYDVIIGEDGKAQNLNPFTAQSMVVRNPTIPHETQAPPPGTDPFLKTLNADEEYSMLNCPGKYTLAIKEYLAASMVQNQPVQSSSFLESLFGGARPGESLTRAAEDAHKLAQMLEASKAGLHPYVLHTRTSSVVSVGAFSGPNDPAIGPACEQIAAWQYWVGAKQSDHTRKDPLGLFPTPVPIEVPHP